MDYEVVRKIEFHRGRARKIGEFYYDPVIDGIYYEGPYPFPVQLLISEGLTKIQVTPGFLKLPFIFRGWINLDMVMREIQVLKLAQQARILLHASCVDNTLIVGFPNSGKTYQTYLSVADGGTLISEEYTIVQKVDSRRGYMARPYKNIMRSCFSANTLRACKIEISLGEKISLALRTIRAKIMPFMFEAVIWLEIPVSGNPAPVEKIVYGSTNVEVKNWKHLAILTENEFPFMADAFLEAYAVAANFDLIGIQDKQRRLIKEFVDDIYPTTKS